MMRIENYCGNTIDDLRSGHFKNSYGVEGMCISDNKNWRRIVDVSDEMKNHVLEDVKLGFYKYGGMSGNSKTEENAYYGNIHDYIRSTEKNDRLAVGWTLSQLHIDIANEVKDAVKAQIPSWTWGQHIPSNVLDKIFADESIASIMSGKSGGTKRIDANIAVADFKNVKREDGKGAQLDLTI